MSALGDDHPIKSLTNGVTKQLLSLLNDYKFPRPVDDGAGRIVDQSLRRVEDSAEPWFLFNNFMEVHQPLRKLPQFDNSLHEAGWFYDEHSLKPQKLLSDKHDCTVADVGEELDVTRELYAAAIDYLDRTVSRYVTDLLEASAGPTTVVITADHGEGLGFASERHQLFHPSAMTDSLMHVPLLVVNPPAGAPTGEVNDLVSHLDLATLLRNLARNEWTDIRRSQVVAERVGSSTNTDRYPWLEAELDWWTRSIRCFYRDGEKVEWDSVGNRLQFSLSPPSEERLVERDVSVPVAARRAFKMPLDEYRASVETDETVNINESVEENLEQLGYL